MTAGMAYIPGFFAHGLHGRDPTNRLRRHRIHVAACAGERWRRGSPRPRVTSWRCAMGGIRNNPGIHPSSSRGRSRAPPPASPSLGSSPMWAMENWFVSSPVYLTIWTNRPSRLINTSHQVFMNGFSYRPNKRPGRVIPTGKENIR